MRQVHSTGFYEHDYQHIFHRSLPKLTVYISPLQQAIAIQKRLDALKNPPKPEFKAWLPPAPSMDIEQAISVSASLPNTTPSLPPTALMSASSTTAPSPRHCHPRHQCRSNPQPPVAHSLYRHRPQPINLN
uniref:Uncharacterized protein n=1 Tax=Romanomermis culicivorax TaxID=13658 RepID=A0A915KDV6_ROMCU